jgi:FixJ family two-component response regulator
MKGPQRSLYIVDDDEVVRDSIRMLLESSGFIARDFASFPSPLTISNCWTWSPRRSAPEAIR